MTLHSIEMERPAPGHNSGPGVKGKIIQQMPSVKAFARSLTRNPIEADDLLQETLVTALSNIHRFTPGTNLHAWLFTIARNIFCTTYRKNQRRANFSLKGLRPTYSEPDQSWSLKAKIVRQALEALPESQKEAIILVGLHGLSYEEAASLCGCALGTIKSRVNRARRHLLELLHIHEFSDLFEDEDRPYGAS